MRYQHKSASRLLKKMHDVKKYFMLVLSISLFLSACSEPIDNDALKQAHSLKTDGLDKPLNIHHEKPNFSWVSPVSAQLAYQIQVASSAEALHQNRPDLWDSGKVNSRRSVNIQYGGLPLQSKQGAYWRVRYWSVNQNSEKKQESEDTQASLVSEYSQLAYWEQGLKNGNDWTAHWLQAPIHNAVPTTSTIDNWAKLAGTVENAEGELVTPAVDALLNMPPAGLFRHNFELKGDIVKARLHSTAAGYYEIYVNGKPVSERIMDPGQTDYDKRILYNTDDVIELLKNGENAIAVHLGSGWYHEDIAFNKRRSLAYGYPAFIVQLEVTYADGSTALIESDEQWLYHSSAIVKEGLFSGEVFDESQYHSDWNGIQLPSNISDWQAVVVMEKWPTQSLEPQLLPPVRAVESLDPVRIFSPQDNIYVFDFGQNFTGIPTLNLKSLNLEKDQSIYLRYAEWADEKGNISQRSGGGFATLLNQVDAFKASDAKLESYTPTFTWHGFRYVEIRGLQQSPSVDAISAHLVKSDVARAGIFESSDPHINRVHETALWSYRSNLVAVPMDCPIRERAGWTGDAHAALLTGNYNFNMQNFWEKYLDDFKTATFIAPAIVPGKRTLGKSVDWAVAEVFIAWEHYQHYLDERLLADQYESLLKYMNFGQSELSNFLIEKGYGDWCDPVPVPGTPRIGGRGTPQHTLPTVTSTALFARAANLMSEISQVLNKQDKAEQFASLHQNIASAFHRTFYNPETGHYGSQTADAMALRFDITPPELRQSVADALNQDVLEKWKGHSSVGALGQTWLYLALSDYGYGDTAFNIFTQKGYPGFHYLFDDLNGTTLWERKGAFDPTSGQAPARSLNHPFHGGYDAWFYQGIGGIRPIEGKPGFQDFLLKPVFPKALERANVSYRSLYGNIVSNWSREGDTIKWEVHVPDNSSALVNISGAQDKILTTGEYLISIQSNEKSASVLVEQISQ